MNADTTPHTATTNEAPLATKPARTALTKVLNAVEDLDPVERERVIKAAALLCGIEAP